jgi:hypothetical protein
MTTLLCQDHLEKEKMYRLKTGAFGGDDREAAASCGDGTIKGVRA